MDFGKIQEQWNFQKLKSFKNKTRTSLKSERSFFIKKMIEFLQKKKNNYICRLKIIKYSV